MTAAQRAHREITDHLRGTDPPSREATVKTTPPGRAFRLLRPLRLPGNDEIHGHHTQEVAGVACCHSKLGTVELYL
ncbi:hypothetical protein ACQ4WX_37880 [Streptomyces lasalocidi]